jgi:hypothetical protein
LIEWNDGLLKFPSQDPLASSALNIAAKLQNLAPDIHWQHGEVRRHRAADKEIIQDFLPGHRSISTRTNACLTYQC